MALSNAMNMLTGSFLASYDNRVADVASICSDTAKTLSGFHADHERMATDQRRKLTGHFQDLRNTTAATMNTLDADHQRMANELHQKLVDAHERLISDVCDMRAELHADFNGARKAWTDFSAEMHKRRAHAPSKAAPAAHATAAKGRKASGGKG